VSGLPRLDGQTVAIIGGGLSLRDYDMERVRRTGWPVLAVNNAWKLAPWAVACFFADSRYWKRLREVVLQSYAGPLVTTTPDRLAVAHPRLIHMHRDQTADLATEPGVLAGLDSGTMTVNLAFHMGAKRIVLFGFDMTFEQGGSSHWHTGMADIDHIWPAKAERYQNQFAPKLIAMIETLKTHGVSVERATEPGVPNAPYIPLDLSA